MTTLIQPQTPRLQLRQWRGADREALAALTADPDVMEFFPAALSRSESDALLERLRGLIAENGWGFWAVELRQTGAFIGFVGLNRPKADLPCVPCVEVGWRLARPSWGQGYATEAAKAALQVGFEQLSLAEIVSFTSVANQRSRAVMEKLGMIQDAQHFQHPAVPENHHLREHCLYRLSRQTWQQNREPT